MRYTVRGNAMPVGSRRWQAAEGRFNGSRFWRPANRHNLYFDKTGFAMGLIATTKVVTRSDMYDQCQFIQSRNRECVIFIECVNSTGWVLPLCIIFKRTVHIEGWYQESNLPCNWRIEVSFNK